MAFAWAKRLTSQQLATEVVRTFKYDQVCWYTIPVWSYFAKSNLKIGRKVIIAKIASLEGLKETETGSLSLLETDDVWMIHLFPRPKIGCQRIRTQQHKSYEALVSEGILRAENLLVLLHTIYNWLFPWSQVSEALLPSQPHFVPARRTEMYEPTETGTLDWLTSFPELSKVKWNPSIRMNPLVSSCLHSPSLPLQMSPSASRHKRHFPGRTDFLIMNFDEVRWILMKFAELVWSVDRIFGKGRSVSTNICLQESSDRPLEWFVILMGYAFWNHIHPVAGDINENYKQVQRVLTTATFMSRVLEIHECQKNPIGKIL